MTDTSTALPIVQRPSDYRANMEPVRVKQRAGTDVYSWPTTAPANAVPDKGLAALTTTYADARKAHDVGLALAADAGNRTKTADATFRAAIAQALDAGSSDYPTHPRHEIERDRERVTAILRVTGDRGTTAVQAIAAHVETHRAELITAQVVAAGKTVAALHKARAFDTKRLVTLTEQMAILVWCQTVEYYRVSYTPTSTTVEALATVPFAAWDDALTELARALEFAASFPLGAPDNDDDDEEGNE